MLGMTLNIQPAKDEWTGTVYIRADGSIDPSDAPIQRDGNVYTLTGNITSDADGIVVERNNIIINGAEYTLQGTGEDPYKGIYLDGRSNVTIKNTTITNFYYGIRLSSSSNNTISGNTITANNYYGIFLLVSSNNSVYGNNIANNWFGLQLWHSSNNSITGNNIAGNGHGIHFYESSNNSIYGNNITANSYDIILWYSSNNRLYHNNFINNFPQAFSHSSVNVWDDGYPSGGNYWSDYTGVDEKSGPNQDQPGSDGIGDTPYMIDVNNQDNYPLTKPWSPHDIGITRITTSKTVIGQEFSLNISITIFNYGMFTENFNVTAYANTTAINQTQITLPSRASITITFTWNTTNWIKGNYTITALAHPVPNETDTTDNTHIDGTILVTIPGDVNGDRKVDMKDLYSCLILHFGCEIGTPCYVANYDVNGDGKINMKDIFTYGILNFGESW